MHELVHFSGFLVLATMIACFFIRHGIFVPYSRSRYCRLVGATVMLVSVLAELFIQFNYIYSLLLNPHVLNVTLAWMIVLAICLPFIFRCGSILNSYVSIKRKLFHFLAVLLFFPPLLLRESIIREFMSVAGTAVIGVFIVLEVMRVEGFQSSTTQAFLNRLMDPFLDSKDNQSKYVTSHIQLLAACIVPIWFVAVREVLFAEYTQLSDTKIQLIQLSGILTVGIGDSAAAIVGSLFRTSGLSLPWNTSKTLTGSLAFALSVLAVINSLGLGTTGSLFATIGSAVVESLLVKYDNIVLPIVFGLAIYILG